MIITPRASSKNYVLATTQNIYIFDVPLNANKAEVIRELKAEYPEIEIADVRLLIAKGKPKTVNRGKRSRAGVTHRSNTKKAYVTLKSGEIKQVQDMFKVEGEE